MYNNELYHYGVKGMKWGHRKNPNRFANAVAGAHRRSMGLPASKDEMVRGDNKKPAKRLANASAAAYARSKGLSTKPIADASNKPNKQTKAEATKSAVKKYSKAYDEASKASDIADQKWHEVSEKHKALGKNAISRMLNSAKGTSKEAKAYNEAYEEASRLSDVADEKWAETKKLRKKTGKTAISRTANNIKYRN